MTRNGNPGGQARHASARRRVPTDRLDAMIEEAIVDAYTESEQASGFHATIEQHLELPFDGVVLGTTVTVKKLDVTSAGEITAVCYRGRKRQAIPVLELHCPIHPQPDGSGSRRIADGPGDASREPSS